MTNKGQGLSLNTIIIAALVLIVLVVLILIFTGYLKNWKNNFGSASTTCSPDGTVVSKTTQCPSEFPDTSTKRFADVMDDQKCCLSAASIKCEDHNGYSCTTEANCPEEPNYYCDRIGSTCTGSTPVCCGPCHG
jgi:hypothetical protein